ncbi:MAG TPA: hypothetical protein H9829_06730 [Candidatus Tetragenococcus pullicola]|nr:hypothetical protein [Candidatus Tetragenococcus pullicola]
MKQRVLLFSGIFILCLVLLYMQPVWFSTVPTVPPENEVHKEPPATTLNYVPIQSEGFANWIGKSLQDFQEEYGKADEQLSSGFSFQIHRYFLDEGGYLEVNVEQDKITAIKFLGEDNSFIAPFEFGMTMNDLAKTTMVYPNFKISYNKETVGLELTEDDMNYRPLIAFDNGSFAILFFDLQKGDSSLYSVMYLNKSTLLKLAPYQVTEGNVPRFQLEEDADWEKINQEKQVQSSSIFQQLRKRENLTSFREITTLQVESKEALERFELEPEDILTTERLQTLKRLQEGEPGTFLLSENEMQDLLENESGSKIKGFFEMPVYDPVFTILSWHSDPYLHGRFTKEKKENLAVAYSKENILVLLQESEKVTKESDDQ